MEEKIDLRVVKTYRKIVSTLEELMETTPFDSITVHDLCESAEIRRATFYKHYNDKYDLLSFIIKDFESEIANRVASRCDVTNIVEYISMYCKEVLDFFELRQVILRNIFKSEAFFAIYNIIIDINFKFIIRTLEDAKMGGTNIPSDIRATASFINGGICTMLMSWLREQNISQAELLSDIKSILIRILY